MAKGVKYGVEKLQIEDTHLWSQILEHLLSDGTKEDRKIKIGEFQDKFTVDSRSLIFGNGL
jgi:hypothetical protein